MAAEPEVDAQERWVPMWHALFFVTLVVPTILAAVEPQAPVAGTLALAAVLGALHWVVVVRHPEWWRRPVPMAGYAVAALALFGALLGRDGTYLWLLYSIYPTLFMLLGNWGGAVGSMVFTVVALQRGGLFEQLGRTEAAVQVAGPAVLGLVIAVFMDRIQTQSQERAELLTRLASTQRLLAERARETGVLQERQRLAQEIHDTLAQGFTSIVMQLEAADQALPRDPATAAAHVDRARRTARDSLQEARRTVQALRPQPLETASLPEVLARAVAAWAEETGIPAASTVTGSPEPLPPDVEVTLLRVAQEALANVRTHAGAGAAMVTLSYMDDLVALDVGDDGRGFDASAPPRSAGGYGLIAMRERVKKLGGDLVVESSAGAGTTVAARIPLAAAAPHELAGPPAVSTGR